MAYPPDVTLTQLGAFVLVARLGSVKAAAEALGVSEPAVSQAIAALRKQFGDDLIAKDASGMSLTEGGRRLVGIASQIVGLGAEAEAVIRQAHGAPEQLRVVADSMAAEYVIPGLVEVFESRSGGTEVSVGVAGVDQMGALVRERLADVAISLVPPPDGVPKLTTEPIMRCNLVVVRAPHLIPSEHGVWLVGPCYTDERSPIRLLLARLRVDAAKTRVFPSQAAALAAASRGEGFAPVIDQIAAPDLASGALVKVAVPGLPETLAWHVTTTAASVRSALSTSFCRFLTTPQATQLMHRPHLGVPPNRFRPPVFVTLWD